MSELKLSDAVNTLYNGAVVGFCNPGCRDKFEKAISHFEAALAHTRHEAV
jgi:hypothetical protein